MKTTEQKNAERKLTARIKKLTTDELIDTAKILYNMDAEGSTLVFVFVTKEIDARLTEPELVTFYEMLENL